MTFGFSAFIKSFSNARARHHLSGVISNMPAYLRDDLGVNGVMPTAARHSGIHPFQLAVTAHRQMGLL